MSEKRLCPLRRETVFSTDSMAGSSEANFHENPFYSSRERREAQIADGVLELATGRKFGGDGQASPITERHRV